MVYNLAPWKVSISAPLPVAKRERSGSEALVSVSGHGLVFLPDLAYASMRSCRMEWHAYNGRTGGVCAALRVLSVDVL